MIVCGLIFMFLAVLLKISILSTIGFTVMIIGFAGAGVIVHVP